MGGAKKTEGIIVDGALNGPMRLIALGKIVGDRIREDTYMYGEECE